MTEVQEGETKVSKTKRRQAPARTPAARENQLINLAVDLAERKLRDGTASSQIITTLLHLATSKNQLEMEKLRSDLRVSDAKVKQMEDQAYSKDLYEKAIAAFRSYSGSGEPMDEYDDEELY